MSPSSLLRRLGEKTLILVKLALLERRLLVYGQPADMLCSCMAALLAMLPGTEIIPRQRMRGRQRRGRGWPPPLTRWRADRWDVRRMPLAWGRCAGGASATGYCIEQRFRRSFRGLRGVGGSIGGLAVEPLGSGTRACGCAALRAGWAGPLTACALRRGTRSAGAGADSARVDGSRTCRCCSWTGSRS